MSDYDEPEEDFIPDPDDGKKTTTESALTREERRADMGILRKAGISSKIIAEYSTDVFVESFPDLCNKLQYNARANAMRSPQLLLGAGLDYQMPLIMEKAPVRMIEANRIAQWTAAYCQAELNKEVVWVEYWELLQAVLHPSSGQLDAWARWVGKKNGMFFFNDFNSACTDVEARTSIDNFLAAALLRGGDIIFIEQEGETHSYYTRTVGILADMEAPGVRLGVHEG